jgi:vitamin B12/bleomycin/antimicrobial peptide transport system ATP-binding/permease protein
MSSRSSSLLFHNDSKLCGVVLQLQLRRRLRSTVWMFGICYLFSFDPLSVHSFVIADYKSSITVSQQCCSSRPPNVQYYRGGCSDRRHPHATSTLPREQQQKQQCAHSWSLFSSSKQQEEPSSQLSLGDRNSTDDNINSSSNNNNNKNVSSEIPTVQVPQLESPTIDGARVAQQLQLFVQIAKPYFMESTTARYLLLGVLGLTIANSGVSVAFSYLGKDFWNTLSSKDVDLFYQVLLKYIAALAIGAPVATMYTYQREQLAIHWREWMTARTFELYRNNQVYYKLERNRLSIDNPDQRITEDVNSFTSFSLSLLITLLTSIIDLASFSTILWSIYPQLFVAIILYAGSGTVIATLLGKTLIGLNFQQLRSEADLRYSLVRLRDNSESIAFYAGEDIEGSAIEQRLENVVTNRRKINGAQRNLEFFTNGYRYMVQILPIAVVAPRYFAGAIELGTISQSAGAFNHILSDLSIIINRFESLSSFSAGIERLSSFYEAMRDVDQQKNSTSPLLEISNRTSMIIQFTDTSPDHQDHIESESTPLDERDARVKDLHQIQALSKYGEINLQRWNDFGRDTTNGAVLSASILRIEHLDLVTPDQKRVLIRDLSVNLLQGEHLLIVGDSGTGKSSLLRAIAGLWTAGNGMIGRPPDDDVYFLPQRPYCTVGSLKDQLLYPSLEFNNPEAMMLNYTSNCDIGNKIVPKSHWLKETLSDDSLLEILKRVELLDVAIRSGDGDPVKGLYTVLDWSNILSLGEQQRLAFGRLLVNRPKLVIVDEATSALDIKSEARMYQILQEMARTVVGTTSVSTKPNAGMTYISVGHRPSLIIFHNKKLHLGGEKVADHELSTIEKSTFEIPKQLY